MCAMQRAALQESLQFGEPESSIMDKKLTCALLLETLSLSSEAARCANILEEIVLNKGQSVLRSPDVQKCKIQEGRIVSRLATEPASEGRVILSICHGNLACSGI